MKNSELNALYTAIDNCSNLKGIKFSYALVKNKKMIKEEIDNFNATILPSEAFVKYDNERMALAAKHAKKDDKGKAIIETINGVQKYVMEDMEEFDKQVKELQATHKTAVDERQAQLDALDKFLSEESTIKLHTIKESDIPEDITPAQLEGIFNLIA